jgi:hypothetical protein
MEDTRRRHLTDAALMQLALAISIEHGERADSEPELRPGAGKTRRHEHLRDCSDCRRRYEHLTARLERQRQQDIAEADAAFTPERLAQQWSRILLRLETADRGRIVKFPQRQPPTPGLRWMARRWMAAAAAVGLLVGFTVERFIDIRVRPRASRSRSAASAARSSAETQTRLIGARPEPTAVPALTPIAALESASPYSDEAFLVEIDDALSATRASELQALDAFTPGERGLPITLR